MMSLTAVWPSPAMRDSAAWLSCWRCISSRKPRLQDAFRGMFGHGETPAFFGSLPGTHPIPQRRRIRQAVGLTLSDISNKPDGTQLKNPMHIRRRVMSPQFWIDERVEILKSRRAEDWTARAIAELLGCSRNAVIGKAPAWACRLSERAFAAPQRLRPAVGTVRRPRQALGVAGSRHARAADASCAPSAVNGQREHSYKRPVDLPADQRRAAVAANRVHRSQSWRMPLDLRRRRLLLRACDDANRRKGPPYRLALLRLSQRAGLSRAAGAAARTLGIARRDALVRRPRENFA